MPRPAALLPWGLAVAAVLAQVAYPLLSGEALRRTTVLVVLLFAAASVSHAWVHRGARSALGLVAVAGGGGLIAEGVGVATGWPFGSYRYSGTLGPEVLGVPVVVPLAWTMMSYPVLLAARRVAGRWVAPVGGAGLVAWDIFLDPQMVEAGHWVWSDPTPALPGVPGIPVSNFAGWFLVGTLMTLLLDRVVERRGRFSDTSSEYQPAVLLAWTYVGSVLGNLAFFGRPGVAVVGGLAMGLLVVPYLRALARAPR